METEEISNVEVGPEMTADMFIFNMSAHWPGWLERRNTPLRKLNQSLQDLSKIIQESKEKRRFFKAQLGFASEIM